MSDLSSLGKHLRQTQEEALRERDDLEVARARFLSDHATPSRSRPLKQVAFGLSLAAAAVLAFLALRPSTTPLSFEVEGRAGIMQKWLAAPPTDDLPMRFSDGSSLLLRPATRARVRHLRAEGAVVELDRGALAVSVVHRAKTRWAIHAGPYTVHVIGTRFDVAYEPEMDAFALDLHDGSVRIDGPDVNGRVLVAGQKIELRKPGASTNTSLSPPPVIPVEEPKEVPAVQGAVEPSASSPPHKASAVRAHPEAQGEPLPVSKAPSTTTPVADWRSLAKAGDYRAALDAARALGIDSVLERNAPDEVLMLGDAAFYARDDELAQRVYLAVRRRGPRSLDASAAAFSLARLAMRAGGRESEAARWLRTYLAESPRGPFAREALGRLCEVERARHDIAAATACARQYLEQHPNGPHVRVAREILEAPAR